MKKYLLLLLLLVGLVVAARCWMQGGIKTEEFSHDLRLLDYDGWQYTLKQPANYRHFSRIEWRFWHEVYDGSHRSVLLQSYRPRDAWAQQIDSLPRELPIDILLNRVQEGDAYYWQYRSLLGRSGTGGDLKKWSTIDNSFYSVGFSLPKKVVYKEHTPLLLGELIINKNPATESRVIRWYLEIDYAK